MRHWVSKGSMNIEGLGEKIINQLVNEGYVKSIADLYKLEIDSLLKLERFGEKSANNLLIEINESKNKKLAQTALRFRDTSHRRSEC